MRGTSSDRSTGSSREVRESGGVVGCDGVGCVVDGISGVFVGVVVTGATISVGGAVTEALTGVAPTDTLTTDELNSSKMCFFCSSGSENCSTS